MDGLQCISRVVKIPFYPVHTWNIDRWRYIAIHEQRLVVHDTTMARMAAESAAFTIGIARSVDQGKRLWEAARELLESREQVVTGHYHCGRDVGDEMHNVATTELHPHLPLELANIVADYFVPREATALAIEHELDLVGYLTTMSLPEQAEYRENRQDMAIFMGKQPGHSRLFRYKCTYAVTWWTIPGHIRDFNEARNCEELYLVTYAPKPFQDTRQGLLLLVPIRIMAVFRPLSFCAKRIKMIV